MRGRVRGCGLLTIAALTMALPAGLAGRTARAAAVTWHGTPHWHHSHGYLGASFRDIADDQVASLKLKDKQGAEIVVLDHDGPGCKSGLREHDVILEMNGKTVENEKELRKMLHGVQAGKTVSFLISRDGQQQTISTQLADRDTIGKQAWSQHMTVPAPAPGPAWGSSGFFGGSERISDEGHDVLTPVLLSSSYTGALLEMMGPQLADFFGAEAGLLVRAVDANSPASAAGLRAGDVVLRANQVTIKTGDDWFKTVQDNRGKPIPVVILRDHREQTVTLTPDFKRRASLLPDEWPGADNKVSALWAQRCARRPFECMS